MIDKKYASWFPALAASAMFLGVQAVGAHPHVWVTAETEIEISAEEQIVGFKHKWTFDEYYTSFAITGLDTNGDGVYSKEELEPLAKVNVESLNEFGYFTFPLLRDTNLSLKSPTDYSLDYKDNLLTLQFRLDLEKPVPKSEFKNFRFSVYDPGYYVAVTWGKTTPVRLNYKKQLPCVAILTAPQTKGNETSLLQTLGENIDPSSNMGAGFAQTVSVECKD